MRKIIPVLVSGAAALAVAAGTFGYVTLNKDVTLSVDGQTSAVRTTAGSVGDLLKAKGLAVTERDVVAPGLDAKLADGALVAIRFGREVTFTVDGKPQTIWTTATTVDQAVAALGVDTTGAELSTSRSATIGRQGLAVDIATEKTVVVRNAGKKQTLQTTAQTLGDVLAEAKITVDRDDKLSKAATTRLVDGAHFSYTRVDVASTSSKAKMAYATVRKQTSSLTKGLTKISTPGVQGVKRVTYRVVRHNGKVVSRERTATKIITAPVTQVVKVGTKVKKATSSSAPSVGSGSVWDKIAKCESGGNWSINTGNGFYGGLQFSLSTWRAYGGSGLPNHASRARQIQIAEKIQAAQGWGAWPACTSKLGLR